MDLQIQEYRENQRKIYSDYKNKKVIRKKNVNNKVVISYDIDISSDESSSDESSSDESSDVYIIDSEYESDKKVKKNKKKLLTNKNRKKSIPSTIKRLVWNEYIGEDIGKHKCYCCKLTDITQLSFHCGHVKSEKNGGKIDVSNLRPICQNCNSSMGSNNMDDFISKYNIH
jgi:hypothetical protein